MNQSPASIQISAMKANHWPDVSAIYAQGIKTGLATFETEVPKWEEWDRKHRPDCRLVAVIKEDSKVWSKRGVAGWAALSPVSDRCVYEGVAEVSVYVATEARGQGIGKLLLRELVQQSEAAGIWTLQAGIFPENEASLAIHRANGFRIVGRRERLGQLKGRWRDVLFLERRSTKAGSNN